MSLAAVWTRTVVAEWEPSIVGDGCRVVFDAADEVEGAAESAATCVADLASNGGWRGQAFDAASARVDAIRRDADTLALTMRIVGREIRVGADAVERHRTAVHSAVAAAEGDGCVVGEDWSVTSLEGRSDAAALHAEEIGARLADLHRADRVAADAVVRALDNVTRGESRNFLPLALGAGLLVEALVDALIAAGVVTVGALTFALVDRFGMGAWDTIHDAIPDSFFVDAGPVDEASVRRSVDDSTEPGRQDDYRQVETPQEVRDLFETLAAEGRAIEGRRYPGVSVQLPDGTEVGLRETSKSGGPTIDITYPDGSLVKVHVA